MTSFILGSMLAGTTRASAPDQVRAAFDAGVSIFDQAQQLLGSDPQRAQQLFRSAAQQFESVCAAGIESGPLEYNLGNCYLQAGDTGSAVLHYRRAQQLMPHDPKLAANLADARRRCLTSIPPSREKKFLQDVFFWHYQLTQRHRVGAAIALYVAFWLMISARAFIQRRWLTVTTAVAGLFAAALGTSLAVTDWQDRNSPPGVVLALDVPVHKGPGTGYQRQFEQPLQPGTEFNRVGLRGGWWEIELPDGKTGWIDATAAELISGNNS